MTTEKTSCAKTHPDSFDRAACGRGVLIMIGSVICFTANTLFLLTYLGTVPAPSIPAVAMLFRATVGALIVLAFFRSRRPSGTEAHLSGIVVSSPEASPGFVGTAAYYYTVPTLGAGKATILCNTYVLFAVIIRLDHDR